MKKFFLITFAVLAVASCKNNNTIRTYEMAEQDFLSTLTFRDTLAVLLLGQNFMDALKAGSIDHELSELCVVYQDTLYKVSDEYLLELRDLYGHTSVADYALAGYSFSTPGINDLQYRYVSSGKVGAGPAFSITFNPVKVGDNWFLTIKNGNMPTAAKGSAKKRHPLSEAPAEIHLHTRSK